MDVALALFCLERDLPTNWGAYGIGPTTHGSTPSRSAHQSNFPRCVEASGRAAGAPSALHYSPLLPSYILVYIYYSCSKTTHMHIDKTDKIKIETAGQLYYMMCEVLSNLPKVRPSCQACRCQKIYQVWKVKIEFSSTFTAVESVLEKKIYRHHLKIKSSFQVWSNLPIERILKAED